MLSPHQRSKAVQYLSGDVDVPASVIVILLIEHFGDFNWFQWEPDVLGQEIEDDFRVQMPSAVRDRVWALISALSTDRFYNDPLFFCFVANALSGEPLNMQAFEIPEAEEILWAVIEVGLIDSNEDDDMQFSPEVLELMAQVLRNEGIKPFGALDFVPDRTEVVDPNLVSDLDFAEAAFSDQAEEQEAITHITNERLKELYATLELLGYGDVVTPP